MANRSGDSVSAFSSVKGFEDQPCEKPRKEVSEINFDMIQSQNDHNTIFETDFLPNIFSLKCYDISDR